MKRKVVSTLLALTMVVSGGAMAFAGEPADSVINTKDSMAKIAADMEALANGLTFVSWSGDWITIAVAANVPGTNAVAVESADGKTLISHGGVNKGVKNDFYTGSYRDVRIAVGSSGWVYFSR